MIEETIEAVEKLSAGELALILAYYEMWLEEESQVGGFLDWLRGKVHETEEHPAG